MTAWILRTLAAVGGSAALCVAAVAVAAAVPPNDIPAPVFTDPPADSAHPASSLAAQFRSHGELINAQVYRPPGAGLHPTVVLLHGLPGNEQNLDLAQVIRRAGWTVITFHYRGSWGSGGKFTLRGGVDDAAALLAQLRNPATAESWGVDPGKIVLLGHSYGGFVAARGAVDAIGVIGVALLAPWDPSSTERAWHNLSAASRKSAALAAFDDVDGRLAGATAWSLMGEVVRDGAGLDLARLAVPLSRQPLLVITASRDTDDDKALALLLALRKADATNLIAKSMDADHAFNTARIALEVSVLQWLSALPGAPVPYTTR